MEALKTQRAQIDSLDRDLLRLLNRRAELASEVLALKHQAGLPVCDPRRELEVLARVKENNPGPLDSRAIETIFRQVIYETRRSEERAQMSARQRLTPNGGSKTRARVAFQGEPGAFSEEAVRQLFPGGAQAVPTRDFEALFASVTKGEAEYAVVPLENTLAGPVSRCYDLLFESDLRIIGEAVAHISHCLIALPGARMEDIRSVESHPVALAQCQHFLAANPQMHAIAADDTAGSVHAIMQRGDKTCAAIAGAGAARTYGAQILAERLEDHAENFTRFVLVSPTAEVDAQADKSLLALGLSKRTGVLRDALAAFADRNIDLVAFHPRPVVGRPWEYRFFLDLAASAESPEMQSAMDQLRSNATIQELRVLGSYRAAADIHLHDSQHTEAVQQ